MTVPDGTAACGIERSACWSGARAKADRPVWTGIWLIRPGLPLARIPDLDVLSGGIGITGEVNLAVTSQALLCPSQQTVCVRVDQVAKTPVSALRLVVPIRYAMLFELSPSKGPCPSQPPPPVSVNCSYIEIVATISPGPYVGDVGGAAAAEDSAVGNDCETMRVVDVKLFPGTLWVFAAIEWPLEPHSVAARSDAEMPIAATPLALITLRRSDFRRPYNIPSSIRSLSGRFLAAGVRRAAAASIRWL